ncbi:hypothetical protein GGR57DRAFT_77273 [Xylariaceae sp. FL1272]|nr:hypothetical protein GGR57DRAFT_77273 [Xylariaceae sp. FL1272]
MSLCSTNILSSEQAKRQVSVSGKPRMSSHEGYADEEYDATGLQAAKPNEAVRVGYYECPDVYRRRTPLRFASWGLIYRLLRANLDGLASAACPNPPSSLAGDGAVFYLSAKRVTWLEHAADRVIVHFVDVTTISADLVLGADGIHQLFADLLECRPCHVMPVTSHREVLFALIACASTSRRRAT